MYSYKGGGYSLKTVLSSNLTWKNQPGEQLKDATLCIEPDRILSAQAPNITAPLLRKFLPHRVCGASLHPSPALWRSVIRPQQRPTHSLTTRLSWATSC